MSDRGGVGGIATGDVLLVVAILCLALALVYPSIERSSVRREVDAAATDVEAVRAAAERYRARRGAWPPTAGRHALPAELAAAVPAKDSTRPPRYRLGWEVWEMLEEWEEPAPVAPSGTRALPAPPDSVAHPPPRVGAVAAIVVRSGDARVLAALLARYASGRSFVRDSTWALVIGQVREGG